MTENYIFLIINFLVICPWVAGLSLCKSSDLPHFACTTDSSWLSEAGCVHSPSGLWCHLTVIEQLRRFSEQLLSRAKFNFAWSLLSKRGCSAKLSGRHPLCPCHDFLLARTPEFPCTKFYRGS